MALSTLVSAQTTPWHQQIALQASRLTGKHALKLLIPNGSRANIAAAVEEFTRLSGCICHIEEVPVDDINIELILRSAAGGSTVDLGLPATFGITDLVQAKAILPLDELKARYELSLIHI